jgi:peptidoglycan hydrolase-like protein with peptidoglycan-binding domain
MIKYDVTCIQEALIICGFNPGKADGKMGPNTSAAIKAFQKSAGLSADGIVGPKTAQSLAESLSEETSAEASELEAYFSGDGTSAEDDM